MDDSQIYTGKFPQSFARSTLDVPKIKIEEMEYSLLKNSYGSGTKSLVLPSSKSITFSDSRRAALVSRTDNKPNPAKDSLVTQRAHESNNASCSSFPDPSNTTAEGERPVVTLKNGTTYRIIKSGYRPLFYTTTHPIPKPRTPTPETCLTGHTESVRHPNNDRSDPHLKRITLVHVGFRKSPGDSKTPEKTSRVQVREKHSSSYSRIASSTTRRFIRSAKTHASLAPEKTSEHKASNLVSQ